MGFVLSIAQERESEELGEPLVSGAHNRDI